MKRKKSKARNKAFCLHWVRGASSNQAPMGSCEAKLFLAPCLSSTFSHQFLMPICRSNSPALWRWLENKHFDRWPPLLQAVWTQPHSHEGPWAFMGPSHFVRGMAEGVRWSCPSLTCSSESKVPAAPSSHRLPAALGEGAGTPPATEQRGRLT